MINYRFNFKDLKKISILFLDIISYQINILIRNRLIYNKNF